MRNRRGGRRSATKLRDRAEHKAAHEPGGETEQGRSAPKAVGLAGVLILISLLGAFVEPLSLALLPAAGFLSWGTGKMAREARAPEYRFLKYASAALSATSGALIVLALIGAGVQMATRIEPRWLTSTVTWTGVLLVICTIAFGLAARARGLPPGSSVVLALSLPLGLGLDAALSRIPGLFLQDAGHLSGLALFGLALVNLSRAPRPGQMRIAEEASAVDESRSRRG